MSNYERLNLIIEYIFKFNEKNGYNPSLREIAKACNIKSTATVHKDIETLKNKGVLLNTTKARRASAIKRSATINIPLLKSINLEKPIFNFNNYEDYYTFPSTDFEHDVNLFMLNIQDDSMINANINIDDKVIVREQNSFDVGDIVVIILDDSYIVRKVINMSDNIMLHAENDDYQDYIYNKNEFEVIGKVIGLLKKF